jgi:hypothetical protein
VRVKLSADKRLAVAWLVLVAITLTYLLLDGSADHRGVAIASTSATLAAIVLALVKVRIIMRELMDVRHAPRVLRTMTDLLLVVMAAGMIGSYLVGKAVA